MRIDKTYFIPSAIVIVFVLGAWILATPLEAQREEMKTHIGETIIIVADTLVIVDYYHFPHNSYKLSNGSTISIEYFNSIN